MFQDNNDQDNNPYSTPTKRGRVVRPPSPVESLVGGYADVSGNYSMPGSGMGSMLHGHGSYTGMPGNCMKQQVSSLAFPSLSLESGEEGVEVELKSYLQHIAASSDYVTELVTDYEEYDHQLQLAERGSIEDKISIKGMQTKSNAGLDRVTVSVDKEEDFHDRGIAAVCEYRDKLTNEMETIKRKIESCNERELHLRKQKILTIGKAKAYVYIGRKALHNINQALKVGPNNMEDEDAKKKWRDDLINEQKYLQNGEEESIALILKRMKADGANGSDGV